MKSVSSFHNIDSVRETAYGFRTKLKFFVERIEILRRELGKEKSQIRILDVGCGNGRQVTFPLGSEGYSVAGIDVHKPTIALAEAQNNFKNVEFISGDIKDLKHKLGHAGKFDIVILSDILEHLSHPENLLFEAKNILSPHGIILISIPNGYGPFEIENFILRKTGILKLADFLTPRISNDLQTLNKESGHVQFFTMKHFESLISRAGLKISSFKKGSFLCGPISSRIIGLIRPLVCLNMAAGRYLPSALCSVWYFEIRSN
ncbi:methyltransferase domain-containing protein [Candidatus Peregrinibacteria bacterium]|nr:methyltransferase domain-containing protein [Candidatus Peregrinibacteria bacterium]